MNIVNIDALHCNAMGEEESPIESACKHEALANLIDVSHPLLPVLELCSDTHNGMQGIGLQSVDFQGKSCESILKWLQDVSLPTCILCAGLLNPHAL